MRGEVPSAAAGGEFTILRSLPHGHVAAVLGTMRRLGVHRLLDGRASRERSLVLAMLAARLIDPRSKLATACSLQEQSATSTLAEELPVAVEVFAGNTGDPSTLAGAIEKIRKRFGVKRVILVGDRRMITARRIERELRGVQGLQWITALRTAAIRTLLREGHIERSLFDEQHLAEISSPDYPGERLIVCRNPFLAEERARKREQLLAATEKQLEVIGKLSHVRLSGGSAGATGAKRSSDWNTRKPRRFLQHLCRRGRWTPSSSCRRNRQSRKELPAENR